MNAAFASKNLTVSALPLAKEAQFEAIDWSAFELWLKKELSPKTVYDRLYYARKFYQCLMNRDLKPLFDLSRDKQVHCLAALSSLSKFLGVHGEFLKLVKDYGLRWSVRSDDLIIARFTKITNSNEVFEWIRQVKKGCLDLADFMDLMAITGLRFNEALESYNLIIRLAKEGKLSEYYDVEREILEHYKFKEIFIRRTKKAFISFVPKELIKKISNNEALNIHTVQTRVKRKTKKLRFGDIREAHGTFLTKFLRDSEVDFLHGRISGSVFMRNYFNPALIGDLKERVFRGITEIQNKL